MPPRGVFTSSGALAPAGDLLADLAEGEVELPGLLPGMSRAELLEQLAKLREQGDLSGAEYKRARERLTGDPAAGSGF